MADEGSVAVAEAPVVDAGAADTGFEDTAPAAAEPAKPEQDKIDGRNQPDSLKKRISELRRQADAATDPAEKAALLKDAKDLNNKVGKVGAYEQLYPTVREARETKTLLDSFGGREGLLKTQETLTRVQAIDQQLEAGDPQAAETMWKEAPQGMVKLAPMIFSELEKNAPQEYDKAVVPHAVKFFDKAGFPEAFDSMVEAYKTGNKAEGDRLSGLMAKWFASQRGSLKEAPKVDPRVAELESKLKETTSKEEKQAVDRAYNDVVTHAGPVIDKYLKPIVAKLGLTAEQYADLRNDTWEHLQTTRNADVTYKTLATAKQKQGMAEATAYIKQQTEERANDAARAMATRRYGHQLKNGAVAKPNPTATPLTPGITKGKEPSPSEIDYSGKGIQVAKKLGFKDLADMILAGKAPLKAGGIRQWR